jgi:hypothetical protein
MEAISLDDCGVDQDAEGDDAAGDDGYDENLATYSWYGYQLSQEQAEDGSLVCQVVQGFNGQKTTVYDKTNSGTMYNYKKNWSNSKNGMSPGGVATLVIFIIAAAAGAAFFFAKGKNDSGKKTPLLNTAEGTMA